MTGSWGDAVLDLADLQPRRTRRPGPPSKTVRVQQFYAHTGSVIATCDEFDLTYLQFRTAIHGKDEA